LHGQSNVTLGDREFQLSVKLLTEVLDQATARFPEQSIRFHFEAREATSAQAPHMYIFAEPVLEEEIVEIQNSKKEEIEAFEHRIFHPQRSHAVSDAPEDHAPEEENELPESVGSSTDTDVLEDTRPSAASEAHSNAADVEFLDSLMHVDLKAVGQTVSSEEPAARTAVKEPVKDKPILGWKLHIRNIVNGLPVVRPQDLKEADSWSLRYLLQPLPESASQRNYLLCKNRRKAALEAPQEQDDSVAYYIKRLVSMSREGARWRRKLDALDAKRDRVVLYGKGKPTPDVK